MRSLELNAVLITVFAMQSVVVYGIGKTDPIDISISFACYYFALRVVLRKKIDCLGRYVSSLIIGSSVIYSFVATIILVVNTFRKSDEIDIDQIIYNDFSTGDASSLIVSILFFIYLWTKEKMAE